MESQERPRYMPKCVSVKITLAIVAVLLGLMGFVVFGCVLKNWNAAAFGLIGAIIATTSLHLHVSYKFGVLGESWTRKRVQRATYVVFVILIGCLIASITYFAIAIIKNIPMKPYSDSLILAGIQAFLSFKSCIVFLYFGYKYGKLLEDEVGLITSEEFNEDTSAINDDEEVV